EFLTNSIPQMLTPRPVPQMRATLRKMVATRSGDVVSRTRAPLRSSDQRSHWNNHGWLSGRLDGALMGRLGPRLLGRLLLGEFQEHVFQGAVQRRLLPQHLQRPAADQPAAVDDADAVRQLLDDVQRVRRQEDRHAAVGLLAEQVLEVADRAWVEP